jgi:hypothetical protein
MYYLFFCLFLIVQYFIYCIFSALSPIEIKIATKNNAVNVMAIFTGMKTSDAAFQKVSMSKKVTGAGRTKLIK